LKNINAKCTAITIGSLKPDRK